MEQAEALFREAGDQWGLVLTSGVLAQSYITRGRLAEARTVVRESFERANDLQEILGRAVAVDFLAAIESREGRHRRAVVLAGVADRLREMGQGRAPGFFILQDDVRAAALQYVRKVSGFRAPAAHNAAAFDRAVDEISAATQRLLDDLEAVWRSRLDRFGAVLADQTSKGAHT